MVSLKLKIDAHPDEIGLADFLSGAASKKDRELIERHLASCDRCLEKTALAHEAVRTFHKDRPAKKRKDNIMKRINIYLILAVISFSLSFVIPRYFIQLLVATLLLGIKWIVDSKTTRMLVMIYEAWKKDGDRGARNVLETLETHTNRLGLRDK